MATGTVECPLAHSPLRSAENEASPYALAHFLPAGTLVLDAPPGTPSCSTSHIEGWHHWPLSTTTIRDAPGSEAPFLRVVEFLVFHEFIATSSRVGDDSKLYLRVYLIPFDLRGVEGRLRRRDESTVLAPARKWMRVLFYQLNRGRDCWDGWSTGDAHYQAQFFVDNQSNQTLAEMYNLLPSPCPSEDIEDDMIHAILHGSASLSGMRSTLHRYQRRSVATMLQRELHPRAMLDPLYVPIRGVDGVATREFFIQPATLEILHERPSVQSTRGGILCEELGTGKTVMTLGLILATIDQLPSPEECILDPRPVLTPLALRHFVSPQYVAARKKHPQLKKLEHHRDRHEPQERRQIPSLTESLVHYFCAHPDEVRLRECESHLDGTHLWTHMQKNVPFYLHYEDEPLDALRPSRSKRTPPGPKNMYLSAATLVVVPPNLFNQWLNEINKHCDNSVTARVYAANNRTLPPADELASLYDIILLTHARLSSEAQNIATDRQYLKKTTIAGVSPLLQVRWKRLVIDEGHVAGTTTTSNLMSFIKLLSIERKWIVTGTPTTNLMGLHFGESSESQLSSVVATRLALVETQQEDSTGDSFGELVYPDEFDPIDPSHGNEDTLMLPSGDNIDPGELYRSTASPVRPWTQNDREDLHKLGNMVTSFLEVPPFAADPKFFPANVIAPLMESAGPRPGSVQALRQLMEGIMIRHRTEDVEKDVVLPPLTQTTVLLDLDSYALKTYNVIQAAILINAVDSERRDQDYFFHPRNVRYLQQLIENISQAMFWHVDEQLLGVDEIMEHSEKMMARAMEKLKLGTIDESDDVLLRQALRHVESAARDPVWRTMMAHPYVAHRTYFVPTEVYAAWSIFPFTVAQLRDAAPNSRPYHLLIPDRLKTLRSELIKRPLSQIPRIIEWGKAVSEADEARLELHTERMHVNRTLRRKEQKTSVGVSPAVKAEHTAKLLAAQDRLKAVFVDEDQLANGGSPALLSTSPLKGIRIGNSTSSKLNFILNEVQVYSPTSKFLIFSRSPLTLLYIAEALSLISIQYKLTSQKPIKNLEQDVMTFESSETYRVFLMELKHGARGLNLVTASRVIFCEPVWQADVESQAIKRVHRIGQTSPVVVKTLAIRGTAEEIMVSRRDALKRSLGNNSGKLPDLADDGTMRDFIAHPTFLPSLTLTPPITLDFPFLPSYDGPPLPPQTPLTIKIPARPSPSKKRHWEPAIITAENSEDEEGVGAHTPAYIGTPPPGKRARVVQTSCTPAPSILARTLTSTVQTARPLPSVRFADLPTTDRHELEISRPSQAFALSPLLQLQS